MGFYATGLTSPLKSSILDKLAERIYRWVCDVRFRHRITIHRRSIGEFDGIWNWCHDNFDRQDWVFFWEADDVHTMTFCFRKPKQLVYFALRWE